MCFVITLEGTFVFAGLVLTNRPHWTDLDSDLLDNVSIYRKETDANEMVEALRAMDKASHAGKAKYQVVPLEGLPDRLRAPQRHTQA